MLFEIDLKTWKYILVMNFCGFSNRKTYPSGWTTLDLFKIICLLFGLELLDEWMSPNSDKIPTNIEARGDWSISRPGSALFAWLFGGTNRFLGLTRWETCWTNQQKTWDMQGMAYIESGPLPVISAHNYTGGFQPSQFPIKPQREYKDINLWHLLDLLDSCWNDYKVYNMYNKFWYQ